MINFSQIVEPALLLLVAFVIGATLGYAIHRLVFRPAPSRTSPVENRAVARGVDDSVAKDGQLVTLDTPVDGKKDNLKKIKGVGPKIETTLNGLGIFHFNQIAEWNRQTVERVDEALSFKGRIDREKWVSQAKILAKG